MRSSWSITGVKTSAKNLVIKAARAAPLSGLFLRRRARVYDKYLQAPRKFFLNKKFKEASKHTLNIEGPLHLNSL